MSFTNSQRAFVGLLLLSSAAQRVLASGGDKTPLGRDFCLALLPAFSRSPWERWGGAGSAMSCCEAAAQIPWDSHCTRREQEGLLSFH